MSALDSSGVVELRRYTLHPGARETLIDLFERELVEPQAAVGMHVLAQFRDPDEPDHFVWLRGFPDLAARAPALRAFYGGPVWARHRDAANATMIDSDDVVLLRHAGIAVDPARTGAPVIVTTYPVAAGGEAAVLLALEADVLPAIRAAGQAVRGVLRSEPGPNDFPALPVREDGPYVVTVAVGDGPAPPSIASSLLRADPHVARLMPTERSRPV